MLNQMVLVGRIAKEPILKEIEGKKISLLSISVPRNYKNSNGEYETDFINIRLFGNVAENTAEYCKVGDTVGIKGRVENNNESLEIIAEKVTFLAEGKGKEVL